MQEQYNLFFFNDTATTEIYTLSLHDALPICPPDPAHAIPRRRDGIPNGKTTGSTRGFGNRTGPTRPIPETASTTCRFSVRDTVSPTWNRMSGIGRADRKSVV